MGVVLLPNFITEAFIFIELVSVVLVRVMHSFKWSSTVAGVRVLVQVQVLDCL